MAARQGSGWSEGVWLAGTWLGSGKKSIFGRIPGNQVIRASSIDHFIVKSTFQMTGHGWHLNYVFFRNVPRVLSFRDPKLGPGSISGPPNPGLVEAPIFRPRGFISRTRQLFVPLNSHFYGPTPP